VAQDATPPLSPQWVAVAQVAERTTEEQPRGSDTETTRWLKQGWRKQEIERVIGSNNLTCAFAAQTLTGAGMASWAGEGPFGPRCSSCLHKTPRVRGTGWTCAKFAELMPKVIRPPVIGADPPACRYFERAAK